MTYNEFKIVVSSMGLSDFFKEEFANSHLKSKNKTSNALLVDAVMLKQIDKLLKSTSFSIKKEVVYDITTNEDNGKIFITTAIKIEYYVCFSNFSRNIITFINRSSFCVSNDTEVEYFKSHIYKSNSMLYHQLIDSFAHATSMVNELFNERGEGLVHIHPMDAAIALLAYERNELDMNSNSIDQQIVSYVLKK